jgi:hypothetical protein
VRLTFQPEIWPEISFLVARLLGLLGLGLYEVNSEHIPKAWKTSRTSKFGVLPENYPMKNKLNGNENVPIQKYHYQNR